MNARLALIAVAVLAAALAAAPGAAPTTAHVLQVTPIPPPFVTMTAAKIQPASPTASPASMSNRLSIRAQRA